ncbi:MAG: histidine ammonia-lyase [Calditrichia bacterium]
MHATDKADHPLILDGENLTLSDVVRVARTPGYPLQLSEEARARIQQSRAWVEAVQEKGMPVVYGVNTGFGSKATVSINQAKMRDLQRNLIMSHSAGVGKPLPIDVVRAAMVMRANTFAKGYSGVRLQIVETLLQMLQKGVTPWVPEQGSVGASGDLAPLSHIALVLSRDIDAENRENSGLAYYFHKDVEEWELLPGWEAMRFAGIPRQVLESKEGLALNNGTQISTALLGLAVYDALQLVKQADIAFALSLEALQGISAAFREEIHRLRPHPGQLITASNVRRLTEGSQLLDRHPEKVQDAYSIRCYPQVMAGVRDILDFIQKVIAVEINATNDNPIILTDLPEENKAISGGNFHAQPIALAADYLAIALCEVGSIAERRIFRLSDKNLNNGLPSFLISNDGLESGLMVAQYTAASLVSENKSLAHPASIDSIPTCENQEDHVSMAPVAARKARAILENVQKIIAIELIYAAQALDLRLKTWSSKNSIPLPATVLGKGTAAAFQRFREEIDFLNQDRPLYVDLEKAVNLVKSGDLLRAVEEKIGELD